MNSITKDLIRELKQIDRPSSFCVGGSVQPVMPGLSVDGMGMIALPLTEAQAQTLIGHCRQAPYGKGAETLVDTKVRRVWELDPGMFTLNNPAWHGFLTDIMTTVQGKLGLADVQLECHLYKLLLYEQGSFFVPHRDSEKVARMVATLVVVLPSQFEGGELIVRHEGREETFDFGGLKNQFLAHFAAFYSDCEHEIKPLRSGHRLCLVYNVAQASSQRMIKAPVFNEGVDRVTRVLQRWLDDGESERLLITLEHRYSQQSLFFATLKGLDRIRAQTLADAAAKIQCKVYLALLTYYEMGSAEYDSHSYRSRRSRYYDEEDGDGDVPDNVEMGEIFESSLTVDHWRDPNDMELPFGPFEIEEDEVVCFNESLTAVDPEQDFEGYTGNAGMELTRWYRHAAIVIWPEASHFRLLCDPGVDHAVPNLRRMVSQWRSEGCANDALKSQCVTFAIQILDRWPNEFYSNRNSPKPNDRQILSLLRALNERSLIERYLNEIVLKDATATLTDGIADSCRTYGWRTFSESLRRIVNETNNETIERNVEFLRELCLDEAGAVDGERQALCQELMAQAVAALERWADSRTGRTVDYRSRNVGRQAVLESLFRSAVAVGAANALDALVKHIMEKPEMYDLIEVQVPALLHLQSWPSERSPSFFQPLIQWLSGSRLQLQERTNTAPQPPADWSRPANVSCACPNCAELKRFLLDPLAETHRFRMAQSYRDHLQLTIQRDHCDLACATEKRGSPHTLVCTKTQASYQRRREVYDRDRKFLAELTAMQERFLQLPRETVHITSHDDRRS